jgi:hypothetical protein
MHRALVLLLCLYLLVWVPLTFAAELFATLPSLAMRGMPALLELSIHAVIALFSVISGWMVWIRAQAAWSMARAAVVISSIAALQSLFLTVVPRNVAPGEKLPFATLVIVNAAIWLALIGAARRPVR